MEPIIHYCMDDRGNYTGHEHIVDCWDIKQGYTECPYCGETTYTLEEVVGELYKHLVKDNS